MVLHTRRDVNFLSSVQGTKERRRARERNADLPKVPIGSLGSFKRGMQSMATKVRLASARGWT